VLSVCIYIVEAPKGPIPSTQSMAIIKGLAKKAAALIFKAL